MRCRHFFLDCLQNIENETNEACKNPNFEKNLSELAENPDNTDLLRTLFFPEGVGLPDAREDRVVELRNKRKIRISQLNPTPLSDPGRELLFPSNVL